MTVPVNDNTLAVLDPLSAKDRCDRCGAQAWVRVGLGENLDLLFCGHHFAENEGKVVPLSSYIHDERTHLSAAESRPTK